MRALAATFLLLILSSPTLAQTSPRDEGLRALLAGDYTRAAALLRPLAEDAQVPDHTAAFVMALLYSSGRGVSPNSIAACGLFAEASATPGPFGEQAAHLTAALRDEMGRAAEFCVGNRWRELLGPSNIPARPRGPGSAVAEGFVAAAHDDMAEAVRLTRRVGESDWVNDPAAQFLMAAAYQSGHGVPRDDLRACALYERAANDEQSPFGEVSRRLMRGLWHAYDTAWFNTCQALANLGLDHRFEPVTFALGLGYDVSWDFAGATITYRGASKRFPLSVSVPRGSVYLPLVQTTLYTGQAHTKRDFVGMLFWAPTNGAWSLTWHLFEITPGDIRRVGGAQALATLDHRPSPLDTIDPASLVTVRLNEFGMAEWAVLDPAHPGERSGTIESAEDRRRDRDEEQARQAALARVDWSRRLDPSRLPAFRYDLAEGCSNFQLVAFSDDRAEAIVVRVDRAALALSTSPVTIDLGRDGARVSIAVHVFDGPIRNSPFCTDVGQPLTEQIWNAVSGRLTVELSPPGVTPRNPALYRATIRLDLAQFAADSGKRVPLPAPVLLRALVGGFGGGG